MRNPAIAALHRIGARLLQAVIEEGRRERQQQLTTDHLPSDANADHQRA